MLARRKSKIKYVNAFISHRCKDYDDSYWREPFEYLLNYYSINPVYGCLLEQEFKGVIEDNINLSMKRCDIYIAVMTELWKNADKEGWPKKEYEFWKAETNDNLDRQLNVIAFLIDIKDRKEIPILENLYSFYLFTDSSENPVKSKITKSVEPLFNELGITFYAEPKYIERIENRLFDLVKIARILNKKK